MIYDCFMFYNEFRVLKIRLEELAPVVDRFIIMESPLDSAGNERELLLEKNAKLFPEFKDKITLFECSGPRTCNRHLNHCVRGENLAYAIEDAEPDDMIIWGDVDEIPRRELVLEAKKLCEAGHKVGRFRLETYHYAFNNRVKRHERDDDFHPAPAFARLQHIYSMKCLSLGSMKKESVIRYGGWHLSYVLTPEEIVAKLNGYAHTECDNEYYKNVARIQDCMNNNTDIFNRNLEYKLKVVPLDAPRYVMENQEKFKEFIW